MTCQTCHAPTDSTYLCQRCAADLTAVLEQIPDALADAEDTIARMDVTGTGGAGKGGDRPDAANVDALDLKIDLEEKIHSWARMLLEEDNPQMSSVEPLTYLRMSVPLIVTFDWAGELNGEIGHALHRLMSAVDIPPDSVSLGQCRLDLGDGRACPGTIRGHMVWDGDVKRLATWAKCRTCKSTHSARLVSADRMADAWGVWCTVDQTMRVLHGIEGAPSRRTLERWVAAGKLMRKPDAEGPTLIRPAQVLEIIRPRAERVA